jgi:reverse transcriptase-like protein
MREQAMKSSQLRRGLVNAADVHHLLRGIGKASSTGPTLRSVRRMSNLLAARSEINRRPVGVDGFPYEAYVNPRDYARWDPNLLLAYDCDPMVYLQEEFVFCFRYQPDPTEPIKVNGRVVERGTVANRIVDRSVARKLSANLDSYFSDRSWAYRPGRSTETAILEVRRAIRGGAHWALKTDIKHFFPSINRRILELQLRDSIADQRLCEFILGAIAPLILVDPWTQWVRTGGLPQGNGLSPFLSNLYLHRLDEACSYFEYFRFADDILALGSSREEVLEVQHFIERLLAQLGLRFNEEKTFIRDVYRGPVVFLGYEIRGGNVYPPKEAIARLRRKLRFREQGARKALMMQFVRRFQIGPVRKLFRRLDRELHRLYPPGLTLTGLLDGCRGSSTGEVRSAPVIGFPRGRAA